MPVSQDYVSAWAIAGMVESRNIRAFDQGDGSGLHDLRLMELPHVHVALRRPRGAGDVA